MPASPAPTAELASDSAPLSSASAQTENTGSPATKFHPVCSKPLVSAKEQGKKVYKTTAVQCDYLRLFVIVCWHRGEAIELKGWSRTTTTTSYSALLLTAADRCKNKLGNVFKLSDITQFPFSFQYPPRLRQLKGLVFLPESLPNFLRLPHCGPNQKLPQLTWSRIPLTRTQS